MSPCSCTSSSGCGTAAPCHLSVRHRELLGAQPSITATRGWRNGLVNLHPVTPHLAPPVEQSQQAAAASGTQHSAGAQLMLRGRGFIVSLAEAISTAFGFVSRCSAGIWSARCWRCALLCAEEAELGAGGLARHGGTVLSPRMGPGISKCCPHGEAPWNTST